MKLLTSIVAVTLMCMAPLALAHDTDSTSGMSKADTNGDGMISKDEFMAHQQAVWDKMPKNKDGMVMAKDMSMHHHDTMHKSGVTMENESMQSDKAKQDKVKPTEADKP